MLWVAALGLLGGLYLLFSMLENDTGTVSSVDSNGSAMVVLEQGRNGHYEAEGQINGQSVTFLVDTGATDVALPKSKARALGLGVRSEGESNDSSGSGKRLGDPA